MNIETTDWDLIIIGGGITGAGILREAVGMGLRAILLEQKDFAWGTSSRSSKLVHGGLRYLKEGRFLMTRTSVKERERLIKEAPGLVDPLGFFMPVYKDHGPGRWTLELGLSLYDLMAGKKQHRFIQPSEFCILEPHIKKNYLSGGFHFIDAQVDDARLVLRLMDESVRRGGIAVNYAIVREITRNPKRRVAGVVVEDSESLETKVLHAPAVINATGVFAEKLHPSPEPHVHLRPLRGSHLIFPFSVLPATQAVSFLHPEDRRPVFIIPWEGAVLYGTTDLDHRDDLSKEPAITPREVSYLMEGIKTVFPSLDISSADAISTFSGIRPVLSKGNLPPSKESREHAIWVDCGLITVTGGKLTTFRKVAADALKSARPFLPSHKAPDNAEPVFAPVSKGQPYKNSVSAQAWRRLCGRYGEAAGQIIESAQQEDLSEIPGTRILWAEFPFCAGREQVKHLSDLLLRRVRIGLLTPNGGESFLDRVEQLCRPVLPWDQERWANEKRRYLDEWKNSYSLPGSSPLTRS